MLERSEAMGQASGLLDQEVDGLGSAVADPIGLEPDQDGARTWDFHIFGSEDGDGGGPAPRLPR